mgnify:CR=1 FL=1
MTLADIGLTLNDKDGNPIAGTTTLADLAKTSDGLMVKLLLLRSVGAPSTTTMAFWPSTCWKASPTWPSTAAS